MAELNGKDFVALRRLSLADDTTIAAVGETCEKVPAAPGGTKSEALARLLASGKIAPVARVEIAIDGAAIASAVAPSIPAAIMEEAE